MKSTKKIAIAVLVLTFSSIILAIIGLILNTVPSIVVLGSFVLFRILVSILSNIALIVLIIILIVKTSTLKKKHQDLNVLFGLWIATLVFVILDIILFWIPIFGWIISFTTFILLLVSSILTIVKINKHKVTKYVSHN
ncbi:hypothetical protein [[Mycoplasma] collis]|uniref:hypothetical protein n=1 Tax=[Mycoplasma] collis TaxID=2127 RepID=UPI00051B4C2D|nr:hypothetical protein [[Mycoplasma] collis]